MRKVFMDCFIRWPKSVTAISVCSPQFQFVHGNFNLLTAISIYSRQFQFAHGNFNLLTAISTCSRQFQFAHGNFNLFTAISIFPRNFNFFTATLTAFFASLTICQLRRPTVATKSQNAKSRSSYRLLPTK